MKTISKKITKIVQGHILNYYEDRGGIEGLKQDMEAVKYNNMGDYEALKELVMGGCFLVYNEDMRTFLSSLGIPPITKNQSNCLERYAHLIAREGLKLIEEN